MITTCYSSRVKSCHRCLFNFDLLSHPRASERASERTSERGASAMHYRAYGYHRATWPLSKFISSCVFGPLNCWFNVSFPCAHDGTIISRCFAVSARAPFPSGIFRRGRPDRNGTERNGTKPNRSRSTELWPTAKWPTFFLSRKERCSRCNAVENRSISRLNRGIAANERKKKW